MAEEQPSTTTEMENPENETTEEPKVEGKDIYASGFPASFDEDQFKKMFDKFCTRGEITNCRFRKHVVGSQTGYGFLTFSNKLDAEDAIRGMNGIELESEMVKVTDSSSPEYSQSSLNLYVEGVPTEWDEPRLRKLFEPMGNVTNVKILINRKTNEKTGVGFVHFSTQAEARKAVEELHGTTPEGTENPLTVRFARTMGRKRGPKNRNRGGYGRGGDYGMGNFGYMGGQWGYPGMHPMMYGGYGGGYGGGFGGGFGYGGRGRGRGGWGGRRGRGRGQQRSSYRPY